jgi:hypothetical protein
VPTTAMPAPISAALRGLRFMRSPACRGRRKIPP